jgi:hypothetical protein
MILTPQQIAVLKEFNFSQEQLEQLKAKHGEISLIVLENKDTEQKVAGLFRQPDRKIMSLIGPYIESNSVKAAELITGACMVAGAEVIKSEPAYYIQAGTKIMDQMPKVEAQIVNF